MRADRELTVEHIAQALGVSRATVYRALPDTTKHEQ
jgi:AcrR family transcriptional regulator